MGDMFSRTILGGQQRHGYRKQRKIYWWENKGSGKIKIKTGKGRDARRRILCEHIAVLLTVNR